MYFSLLVPKGVIDSVNSWPDQLELLLSVIGARYLMTSHWHLAECVGASVDLLRMTILPGMTPALLLARDRPAASSATTWPPRAPSSDQTITTVKNVVNTPSAEPHWYLWTTELARRQTKWRENYCNSNWVNGRCTFSGLPEKQVNNSVSWVAFLHMWAVDHRRIIISSEV